MGKNKKKQDKVAAPAPGAGPGGTADRSSPDLAPPAPEAPADTASAPHPTPAPGAADAAARPGAPAGSRLRRLVPDLVKVALALAAIGLGAAIWYKPPLIRADFPYVSYRFQGQTLSDAVLYRPLAMPTRYYIALPRQLAGRYTWFAVDRRREVVALSEAPRHFFLKQSAIKRSDPLGLDLEFRKLDNSEWQVHFFDDAVVFSNSVLAISMETTPRNTHDGK